MHVDGHIRTRCHAFPLLPKPSMFTTLVNTYKAQSSVIMRFLWGDNEVDHDDSKNPPGHDDKDGDLLGWVISAPPHATHHWNVIKHQR